MIDLGRWPGTPLDHAFEREGEGLALLADIDPEDGAGLAAWAAARMPWPDVLGQETSKPHFDDLVRFVTRERAMRQVYPAPRDVFAAFRFTPYCEVRVVILGQDPYPNPGQANGLCFSVPKGAPSRGRWSTFTQPCGSTDLSHPTTATWRLGPSRAFSC